MIRLAGKLDTIWESVKEFWDRVTHLRERQKPHEMYEEKGKSPENSFPESLRALLKSSMQEEMYPTYTLCCLPPS